MRVSTAATLQVSNNRPNKRVEPTGWIGVILAPESNKIAFPLYGSGSFQPAAHAQAVGLHLHTILYKPLPHHV
jgi:hypothetical protein